MGDPGEAASLPPCSVAGVPFQGQLGFRDLLWSCFACFLMTYCAISQIYWLHMVYAALGAICFTLVSLFPLLGRELRWWSLGSLGSGEEPWTIALFLM